MSNDSLYLLGHSDPEWDRLRHQHELWRDTLLDALPGLGFGRACHVLEAGCGTGVLLRDLAAFVGSEGRAVGLERDPDAVAEAREAVAEMPWTSVEQADLFDLKPAADPEQAFDLIVARWVVGWLPNPEVAIANLVGRLRSGGVLLLQDYNYDSIRIEPDQPGVERLFEVMPRAYAQHGGDAWRAAYLPRLLIEAGLEGISVEPHCKAGGPDSGVFQWVERFFRQHVSRLVEDGLMTEEERIASLDGWDRARTTPGTVFFSPLVVNVSGRLP